MIRPRMACREFGVLVSSVKHIFLKIRSLRNREQTFQIFQSLRNFFRKYYFEKRKFAFFVSLLQRIFSREGEEGRGV